MLTPEIVLDELMKAKDRGDVEECVRLCREGIRLSISPNAEEWYAFRFNLARFLMSPTRSPSAEAVDEAIGVYSELAAKLPREAARARAASSLGLGWAYYFRVRGNKKENLHQAARSFSDALNYYTRVKDAHTWASLKAALGQVFSEMGNAPELVVEAINNYEEASEVLTASDYPKDWEEIQEKLSVLRRRQ